MLQGTAIPIDYIKYLTYSLWVKTLGDAALFREKSGYN
jgi:hypothetical protein